MFRSLLPRLLGEDPPETTLSHDDAEVAIAALMVRIARADNHYGKDERTHIDALLARRRNLSAADAADRRAAAEMIEAEAPDTVRFTRAIKDRIALEERAEIIGALWEIALADGTRSPDEDAMIRLVASLLGVSDVESAQQRQQVAGAASGR
ncbi:tellurite resistance TerB family protein [Paracoccus niistensis]|uniref:TerB family tellurite resistance protein n=1 Tax=Paracoccus niistensis TaxID=632935 RepID=A0ABV6I7Q5_9RHOB